MAEESVDYLSFMPDELVKFIQRDTYSLLIKGLAGTGKTTLSLTILRALERQSKFFYISTRTSPKQLFKYYPWLDSFVNTTSLPAEDSAEHSTAVPASFEDARLDEPESLFELITNHLMDIKSPVIIIDSWDAIASFMDKEARLNNERVLETWRERAGAKLVFISEHPSDTTLDFLVDGIVELKQVHHDGARLRELTLLKMKGVRINRPSYFYTLEGTMFRCISPFVPLAFLPKEAEKTRQKPKAVSPQLNGPTKASHPSANIPTSYPGLDEAIGTGFPLAGVVLVELRQHVTTRAALEFLGRPISGYLQRGNPVLVDPFDSVDPVLAYRFLSQFIPAEPDKRKTKNALRVFAAAGRPEAKDPPDYIMTGSKSKGSEYIDAVEKLSRAFGDRPLFAIAGGQSLLEEIGMGAAGATLPRQLTSRIRSNKHLLLAVVRTSDSRALDHFSEISDIHLRLNMVNGTLILQTIVPSSSVFAMVFTPPQNDLVLQQIV